jgi:glucose-1-phosphate thymidylyltransferase
MPLTKIANKHVLPVWDRPMVEYPLQTLVECGATDILVVTGGEHPGDLLRLLGDGSRYGCKIQYAYQEGAGGIAEALGLAKAHAAGGSVVVILGDNIFTESQAVNVDRWKTVCARKAWVFLHAVADPHRFGVMDQGMIVEKPPKHSVCVSSGFAHCPSGSHLAVTGLYLYPSDVFDRVGKLTRSARGELEVTDLNNSYAEEGRLDCADVVGDWTDAGTFESLQRAGILAKEKMRRNGGRG